MERKSHVRAASSAPRTVTILHGTDTTLLGQDADYRTAIGDVTAAAAGLDTLVDSPDLAGELGERSRNRALERFSADRILPRYEALYRGVIAGVA